MICCFALTSCANCSGVGSARSAVEVSPCFSYENPSRPCTRSVCVLQVSEEDFCEGGALAALQMELQLWASYRGQLLARTVRGKA